MMRQPKYKRNKDKGGSNPQPLRP
uniref:Uncharacterized protein n=1 Tax=Anguilla anguilla TaxID=7936 RepID=A0A0E9XYM4_ANGAN